MSDVDALPVAMERGGYYNRHSSLQANAAATALGLFGKAAESVPLEGNGPVRIVDYGSSQGRNSLAPIRLAIETIRRRCGNDRPIEVVHTDLPDNDFTALFDLITRDPSSYLADQTNVYPSAIGHSYFNALFAPQSVDLAWNSITLHWLSQVSLRPRGTFHLLDLVDSAEIAARDGQLMADWERFLALRSSELRPGGRFVGAILARDGEDVGWPVLRIFFDLLKDSIGSGFLSPTESERLMIPLALRTAEQLCRPFGVDGRCGEMQLEHFEMVRSADPFFDEFTATGDSGKYAATWAGVARAIYSPIVAGVLDPGRDRQGIIDSLFGDLAALLRANPVSNYFVQANLVVRRT